MRSPFLGSSLLLLSAALLSAAPIALAASSPQPDACPIGLSADQGAGLGITLKAGHGAATPGQLIHLTIQNKRLPRIVEAELDIHGTSASGRVIGNDLHPEDTVRRLTLKPSVGGDQSVVEDVLAEELTSVASIEVKELRYADGSVWHVSTAAECITHPNGLMLAGK